ncbi:MAG: D-cysteine desulfhydrase [Acidobacteria bacterium]|nr:MAG: D-cysteine desulfhydrase [Acidobacteriota bacterium]
MHLARFPRRRYTEGWTPLERLERLSRLLGGPDLYIKRDDLLGLAGGGNKTRKLEFLVADALAQGADTLITCGAVQSNHCRLTLAAAVKEGLKCRLVLEERVAGSYNPDATGNNFLFKLLGVEAVTVVKTGVDLAVEMQKVAEEVEALGRKAYIIPGGGSNALGALGYVSCAEEILAQTFQQGVRIDHVVCASGSTGTHAGLLTGLVGNNSGIPVTGINVRRTREEQEPNVHRLAQQVAALLCVEGGVPRQAVRALGDWVGPGYSLPTAEMVEAVRMVAQVEGILLDPVYTGKAMAGLIGLVRRGELTRGQNVLFLHTGGAPALYAYQQILTS